MVHPAAVHGGDLALGPHYVTLRHLAILLHQLVDVRERAPFARALGVVTKQAQDLESLGGAMVPKPAVRAIRLGISAEQLLAVC
jgi:hypothetical protein